MIVVATLPEFSLDSLHHLQIQITRGLIKQSLCYLWFDGSCVELTNQGRLRYPSGTSSSYQINSNQSVSLVIGASGHLSRIPTAGWSFSSIHCFNDVLPANSAFNIYEKGALYRGCFQQNQLVNEDSVALALFPENYSFIPSEKCGIIKNGVSSLTGYERPVGAFLSDSLGTHSDALELLMPMSPLVALFGVGGLELFLSLIEQAETVDTLKDALDCFGCAIKLSKKLATDTESQTALPILASLLKKKKDLLNAKEIFQAVCKITGTSDLDSAFRSPSKDNPQLMGVNLEALEVLLIDLSLWKDSECFRLVLEHLTDLLDESYSTSHLKGIFQIKFKIIYIYII